MNASNERLQRLLTEQRAVMPLKLWVLAHCPEHRCSVQEQNCFIEEQPGCKPIQAPLRCGRDGVELEIDGVENEHGRKLSW